MVHASKPVITLVILPMSLVDITLKSGVELDQSLTVIVQVMEKQYVKSKVLHLIMKTVNILTSKQ